VNKKLPTSTTPVNKKLHMWMGTKKIPKCNNKKFIPSTHKMICRKSFIFTEPPVTHNQKLQPPQPHHKKPIPTNPPPQTHNQKSLPPQKITATTTTNHSWKTIPTNPQSWSHHIPTLETHTHKPTELNSFNHTHYTEPPPVDHRPIATAKPTTQNFNPLPTAAVSHLSHRW
jgi:hypothetical protein